LTFEAKSYTLQRVTINIIWMYLDAYKSPCKSYLKDLR
jgi:hypothetical protein